MVDHFCSKTECKRAANRLVEYFRVQAPPWVAFPSSPIHPRRARSAETDPDHRVDGARLTAAVAVTGSAAVAESADERTNEIS